MILWNDLQSCLSCYSFNVVNVIKMSFFFLFFFLKKVKLTLVISIETSFMRDIVTLLDNARHTRYRYCCRNMFIFAVDNFSIQYIYYKGISRNEEKR